MGIKSHSTDTWGMGLLLVFFSDSNSSSALLDKSASSSAPTTKTIKRTNSNNPILTKTQSTISICAFLLLFTLLLFTLSTFEPAAASTTTTARRFLPQKLPINAHHKVNYFSWLPSIYHSKNVTKPIDFALQGMGQLYVRGTKPMNDLLVAHLVEDLTEDEFKFFLRLLLRSGLTSKADLVLVFPSSSSVSRFQPLIQEEANSFFKLVGLYKELNRTSRDSVSAARFDVTQFVKHGNKDVGEPLWGKRIRVSNLSDSGEIGGESTRLSYGSVVGFETSELDPESSLAGFVDHVPMSLKRWACYPMLIGRVRRNFKHIMLLDVKKLLLLSDPLSRVRNRSPESVYLTIKQESSPGKHGQRNSDRTPSYPQVNSAIIMGGTRGIRRFSSAMLTEIVRGVMQHKKKILVTESAILSQLVGNGHILKNIELIKSSDSIPEASSLSESNPKCWNHKIIQRGNGNYDVNSVIMEHVCSYEVESSVYRDCHRLHMLKKQKGI